MKQEIRRPAKIQSRERDHFAVIVLYLLTALAMIATHHMQPEGQETVTSSTSPAHGQLSSDKPTSESPETVRKQP